MWNRSSTARGGVVVCCLGGMLLVAWAAGCSRKDPDGAQGSNVPNVQGTPIASGSPAEGTSVLAASNSPLATPQVWAPTELDGEGFLRLGFDRLSAFKYQVYEYYSEGVSGRPLLKSDDVIPEWIKNYDGAKVSIRGFVLPLRTRKGKVTEFLLLRDQGTCCFGPQAQINHFIRVNHPRGTEFDQAFPHRVRGVLRVGETYVQGYLTGIYQLEAESVERSTE